MSFRQEISSTLLHPLYRKDISISIIEIEIIRIKKIGLFL